MTIFIGALMTASICGTAIGGIVADRVGPNAAFAASAAIAALAGVIAWRMVPSSESIRDPEVQPPRRDARHAAQSGVPGVPPPGGDTIENSADRDPVLSGAVRLSEIGAGQADIARVLIIYSFMNIAAGPMAARSPTAGTPISP